MGGLNVQGLLKDREQTLATFRNPHTSPLAAVARHEFPRDRTLVFGSAPECDVQLEGIEPRALEIRALADHFETGEGKRLEPGTRLDLGRYAWRLSHQNFPAVVVLDPASPRLNNGPFPGWVAPD